MTKKQKRTIVDLTTINITGEAIKTKWSRMTPPAIKGKVDAIHSAISKDPGWAIREIQEIQKTYKDIPILNNFLAVCYMATDDYENAELIAAKNYRLFPRYLFAKTNYAQLCLHKGETHKIKKIFENKSDLQSLYPGRKEFHVSEFLSFVGVWAVYYHQLGEQDLAETYYTLMKKTDRSHSLTKSIKQQIYPPLRIRVIEKIFGKERLKRMQKEIEEEESTQNAKSRSKH